MNNLREAALQLLEDWDSPNMYVRRDSYEALRAALSAQSLTTTEPELNNQLDKLAASEGGAT